MTEGSAAARAFGFKVALFYGALFVIYGMHVPFTPMWLNWRGLSASEIATVMAAPFFLRLLVTPGVALAADRAGSHRTTLIVLAWISLILVLLLSQAASFWSILLLIVPFIICNSTIMPLTETVAVKGVRDAGLDYGRMRLWGSLTFVAASFAGGIAIDHYGAGAGIWLVASGCVVTVLAAHFLPRIPTNPAFEKPAHSPLWHVREPRLLLSSKPFVAFLLAAGLVQAAHATLLTFGTLIWQKQGLSAGLCGALWAIAVFAEVALFAFSGKLIARFGAAELLIVGAASSVLRWAIMAFDPPLGVLVPLQILHAFTYGGAHIGAIHFIHQAVPAAMQGSAQALYATIASGLAMGIATLIAGRLYGGYAGGSYWAMAAISLVALGASIVLHRIWDRGTILDAGGPQISEPRVSAH